MKKWREEKEHTILVVLEWLDRETDRDGRGSEYRRGAGIAEGLLFAWRGTLLSFLLSSEQHPSCHGPSSQTFALHATSLSLSLHRSSPSLPFLALRRDEKLQ